MIFSQKCAFRNENVGAVSFLQFELFLAHKSDTSRTGQYKSARYIMDLLRTHSGIRRTMPDESGAARLHIGLIDNLNARLPRHTHIACDGFITLGLWLSVSIRSRLSSLTSHLRYVKPEMLSLALSRSSRISGLVRLTAPPSETT